MNLSDIPRPRLWAMLSAPPLTALFWFLGPFMGLEGILSRLAVILLCVLLAVSYLLWRKLRAAQSQVAAGPEPAAAPAGKPAEPASTPRERALIREQVRQALAVLKTSHIGATRGRAALYELPWLLVIGPAGSGKSQVIQSSGLTFPIARPGAARADGPDPGQFCQWSFATEGVLLDTPGRYCSEPQDQAEWREFLGQLRAHRPGGPLEAVLVAVALPDLLQPDRAAASARARQIRECIGKVESCLRRRVPVYLLFTKMDLLEGFTPFFGHLTEEERREVWGATLPHEQGPGFDPLQSMEHHLALLHQGLAQRAADRLGAHRTSLEQPALATFPMAFRQLAKPLLGFMEHLVGDDPYHARPLIRGFYFASATQGPPPEAGPGPRLGGLEFAAPAAPAGNARPHFLEHLFRQVIFPDRHLAAHLGRAWPLEQLAWAAGGVALLGLLTVAWSWSFAGNRKLVAAVRSELAEAKALSASLRLEDRMQALTLIQLRLEQFGRQREEGGHWARRWGLSVCPQVERTLRSRYFAGLAELMLAPVQAGLEESLERGAREPLPPAGQAQAPGPDPDAELLYNALKTYLMLGDRQRLEAAHLADQLPRFWRPYLDAARASGEARDVLSMAQGAAAFYVSQIKAPDLPLIGNRPELVAEVRRHLAAKARLLTPLEQYYKGLKAKANTEFEPMTVGRLLKDRDLDLMTASHAVPGSFTRDAYEKFFRAALREAGSGLQGSDWVLASAQQEVQGSGAQEEIHDALEALYKADYEREWDSFLQGVTVQNLGDPGRAAQALGRLGDPQNSPIKLILVRAAQQTSWDNPSEIEKSLRNVKEGVIAKTGKLLGSRPAETAGPQYGTVGGYFSALAELATPAEGGSAALDGYLQMLQKAHTRLQTLALAADPGAASREYLQSTLTGSGSELAEAQHYVDATLLARADARGREMLRPLLHKPLLQAFSALVPGAEQDINRAWQQQVWGPWTALANKYPFTDSGNEAPLADIQRFLKPGEGILPRFLDKHLGPLVAYQGDRLTARSWAGRGVSFRPDFLQGVTRLGQAAAPLQESAMARFELQPVPAPGIREIIVEIDGQRLQYRNGPQVWTAFSWPNPTGYQGARIQVVAFNGATAQVHDAPGRLGLLRLLDKAATGPGGHSLEWALKSGQGRIRFNYRMVSGPDPLRLSALRHHSLPAKVTN